MNYKIATATLVLACAFASAGCSHDGNGHQEGPPTNASTQLPQTPPYTSSGAAAGAATAGTANTAGGMAPAGSTAGPAASFDQLAGSKGYITQQDAQRDSWLSAHFSECDANHDGRLTRQEYAQCMQRNGSGAAQGTPASASSMH